MNNVPLINNLTVNDINTALIAIKKNLAKGANGNEQLQDVDVNVDVNIAQNCTYCAADSTTIKGAELFQGCSIKVLFTSAITGSNTTSPLTINYNNVDITVKVGKNGTLVDFVAYNTGSGFVYCQAYTTLELLFDGNNFVIMGNPVVISNSDYTVYTDGSITYTTTANNRDFIRAIDVRQKTLSTGDVEYFDLPALQGVYMFSSNGSYTEATRITAIIYKGTVQTSIYVIDSAGLQLSIENGRLKLVYNFSSGDGEYMGLYQIHRFA
jgi:hypothetical protein